MICANMLHHIDACPICHVYRRCDLAAVSRSGERRSSCTPAAGGQPGLRNDRLPDMGKHVVAFPPVRLAASKTSPCHPSSTKGGRLPGRQFRPFAILLARTPRTKIGWTADRQASGAAFDSPLFHGEWLRRSEPVEQRSCCIGHSHRNASWSFAWRVGGHEQRLVPLRFPARAKCT